MTEQENTDQITISDQELFEQANEPVSGRPDAEAAPEGGDEAQVDRPRDEKGRFAAKAEERSTQAEPTAEAQPEPPVEQQREEKPEAIPSWRLKEEADAKREALARAEAAEKQAQQLQAYLQQMQRQMQELQPKPEPPDIFADPNAFVQTIEQRMQQSQRAMEGNISLRLAKVTHGEKFDAAWQEVMSRPIDDPMRQQVINSPDPGETLVRLYEREQLAQETGGDLNSWLEKKKQEWLNDPATQAALLEKAKSTAQAQPTQKIDLPPSLNKAPSAAPKASGSADSIWEYASR